MTRTFMNRITFVTAIILCSTPLFAQYKTAIKKIDSGYAEVNNTKLILIKGAGHIMNLDRPKEFNNLFTSSDPKLRPKFVATAPGTILTTRIGSSSSSLRSVMQSELIAALVAP